MNRVIFEKQTWEDLYEVGRTRTIRKTALLQRKTILKDLGTPIQHNDQSQLQRPHKKHTIPLLRAKQSLKSTN